MIAVQPSNLNIGVCKLNSIEISFIAKPFSFSKNKNATTPIKGGVASGIKSNDEKNDFNGILWY